MSRKMFNSFLLKTKGLFIILLWLKWGYCMELIPNYEEIDLSVGATHFITCEGNNIHDSIEWLKPNGQKLKQEKGSVHIEKIAENLLRLVFDKISIEDQGLWTCISTKNKKDRRQFHLKVYEPINFVNLNTLQKIVENKNGTIKCDVTGNPKPTIMWYKNGKQLSEQSEKFKASEEGLMILKASINDSGEYICRALQLSATVTDSDERVIRVNVLTSPQIVSDSKRVFYGFIGGTTNVTCHVHSDLPILSFDWKRSEHFNFSQQIHRVWNDKLSSNLEIQINNSHAFGEYLCNATNKIGSTSFEILLRETKKPKGIEKIILHEITSTTMNLIVKQSKIENAKVPIIGLCLEIMPMENFNSQWIGARQIEYKHKLHFDNLFEIGELKPNTSYLVRATSITTSGLGEWSDPKQYFTGQLFNTNSALLLKKLQILVLLIFVSFNFLV